MKQGVGGGGLLSSSFRFLTVELINRLNGYSGCDFGDALDLLGSLVAGVFLVCFLDPVLAVESGS